MGLFILRRLSFLVFVLLGVSIVTFAISHLVPGDPVRMIAGPRATAAQLAQVRASLGLDRPLPEQYVKYVS